MSNYDADNGLTDEELRATPVPVSGTIAVSNPGLTDTQLRATPVPVSGTVSATVSNFPVTQPVSGTVTATQGTTPWVTDGSAHTQPISGSVTAVQATGTNLHTVVDSGAVTASQPTGTNLHTVVDSGTVIVTQATPANLNATVIGSVSVSNFPSSQPVSGTVAVTQSTYPWQVDGSGHTQPVNGSVSVSNFPATQPVSGTVTISNPGLTDTQLRASAVPVSGTFFQTTQPVSIASMPSTPVTGTFWQTTQPISGTVAITNPLVTVPLVGQAKINITGTAVQLSTQTLLNGVIISARSTNVNPIALGTSSVANTVDGTGNGYILESGCSVSVACANANDLWINGTLGDFVSWIGC